jgi:hypothetical protein
MRQTLGLIGVAILLTTGAGCEPIASNVVRIEVSFNGNPSCFAAGVDSVRVTFPDTGAFPTVVQCDADDRGVIEVDYIEPGTYRVTVDGMRKEDSIWTDREEIKITGSAQTFKVDLAPVLPSVLASFKFAAPSDGALGMTCAQAEVQTVQVSVDDGPAVGVSCHNASLDSDMALVEAVTEGPHDFRFFVTDGQDRTLWEMTTKQTVRLDASNTYNINMVPKLKGSLQIQWTFTDAPMCSAAGVSKIDYMLTKPDGTTPAELAGKVDCADMDGANSNVTFGTATMGTLDVGAYGVAKMQGLNSASTPKVLYQAATPVGGLFVLPGQMKAYNIELAPL